MIESRPGFGCTSSILATAFSSRVSTRSIRSCSATRRTTDFITLLPQILDDEDDLKESEGEEVEEGEDDEDDLDDDFDDDSDDEEEVDEEEEDEEEEVAE